MTSRESGIYWLASSDAQIGRARDILKKLTQPGVLDELGFLVLLGALSDRLYPAMNTIMTRARYLVFVPALCRHLEEKLRGKGGRAESLLRDVQYKLCSALCETNGADDGIIGKQSGRDIRRPPSNVYWTALAQLGIATQRLSESAYLARLAKGSAEDEQHRDDDKVLHESDAVSFWDQRFATHDVIGASGDFPAGTSLNLTYVEAAQLRDRYALLRPDGGESLSTHLVTTLNNQPPGTSYQYPWDVPSQSAELQRVTTHARLLSTFARGAELQYDALLFEARPTIPDPGSREAFIAWHHSLRDDLAAWNLEDFAALPCVQNAPRRGDLIFITNWRNAVVAKNARAAYGDRVARDLIRSRERAVRTVKARLNSPFHLASWQAPDSYKPEQLYALRYRHDVGLRFAADITAGLRQPR